MPKGSPNRQTIANEKWVKNAGLVRHQFKLKKELIEAFKKACERKNITQTKAITDFMEEFIKK